MRDATTTAAGHNDTDGSTWRNARQNAQNNSAGLEANLDQESEADSSPRSRELRRLNPATTQPDDNPLDGTRWKVPGGDAQKGLRGAEGRWDDTVRKIPGGGAQDIPEVLEADGTRRGGDFLQDRLTVVSDGRKH